MTTVTAPVLDDLSETLGPYLSLLGALRAGARVDADRTSLVEAAAGMWSRPGFDTFLSQSRLAFEPFDYQWQTAQTVLRRMRGRAVLADEVGLGKTIEAGLVLSELRMRGLADRVLVVVPPGLAQQWREELERKFALPTTMAASAGWDTGIDHPVVIASLAVARRDPLKSALTAKPWDAIIVDEAHRLRNPRSASGRLARALSARYLLLLTATPVENRLQDLYELVSLVAPGLLGTPAQFRGKHGAGDTAAPRNVAELRATTREVMVRHRRSEVSVMLPQRLAET
ncbi:MAG: DEAD/DEAH box helicase, partial [Streptosporangiaceae bacterium]